MRRSQESERYLRGQLTILHQVMNVLSKADSFDELCRWAVELGRSRLGFDRLGLWFTCQDPQYLKGSCGTDEAGQLRDERASRAWLSPETVIAEVVHSRKSMVLRNDSPLYDDDRHVVGRGQQAIASLWDGEEIIGCLTADNLLSNRPLTDNDCEVLKLYASSLGHLCSRQRAEEALRAVHRQLMTAREDERRRLALELHDSIGQRMIAMGYALQSAIAEMKEVPASLQAVSRHCEDLIREVRHICQGLYPPTLESLGLPASLRQLATDCRSGMDVQVEIDPEIGTPRLGNDVEIALYRITQEAVHNALRHSQARRIVLRLEREGGDLVLTIEDDGKGFDPAKVVGGGLGLSTMRERARTLGGQLDISSRPGRTCIVARVPLG